MWSRFVNTSGHAAKNKPCDLHMEYLNRTAKSAFGQHSCFNPKSVSRVGRSVGLFESVQCQFDFVTVVHHSGSRHACVPATTDTGKIIKQLVENQVFTTISQEL